MYTYGVPAPVHQCMHPGDRHVILHVTLCMCVQASVEISALEDTLSAYVDEETQ